MSTEVHYNPYIAVGKAVGKEMAQSKKLSARTVETLTAAGRHSDGDGLFLNIAATGARSWLFMWKRDGKRREMGLGPLTGVSLAKARNRLSRLASGAAEVSLKGFAPPPAFPLPWSRHRSGSAWQASRQGERIRTAPEPPPSLDGRPAPAYSPARWISTEPRPP